ncbi:fumarylacetoacetate hydrolase family protein [Bacillus sp. 31A1R]|uniref:Fumarylacetoacetate hydrolase family protein n=1 Tax=Robertmurraya mangrovi TaxID=3098077 RepID=A0ABU5IY01_9BACI|nr:fumarylacetoacetate hydrolase family protein [Bacillus sp. 31A1R]MDZ5472029.1 fumarylacetoacetate hydrolase family protein [Bacillus sp. 31A1R]
MKFARFSIGLEQYNGILTDGRLKVIEGNIFEDWKYTREEFPADEAQFLAPLEPNQIIGIGANYVSKLEELPTELPEIPVFFFKPTSSVIGPNEKIIIPEGIEQVKFESELAIVMGKEAKHVSEEDVFDYVFGYTVGNDVTAPQFFHKDGHWMVGKSFDTFTPLGPVIETDLDPFTVTVEAKLNGEQKQYSGTDLMIIPIRKMISYLSKVMTLKPGDVILSGSPIGAEFVGIGAVIECTIKEIGTLRNSFASVSVKA